MSKEFWDSVPDPARGGEFVKFLTIGDQVTGTIVELRSHTWDGDDKPTTLVDIEPRAGGDVVTLSLNKVDLLQKFKRLQPSVGDEVRVKWTGTEKVGSGTKKIFEVQHKSAAAEPAENAEFSDEAF